ncbi:tetratricopeptide repeat protein [Mariniluteicoccus flavus]
MAPRDRDQGMAQTLEELGLPPAAGPDEVRAARDALDKLLADLEPAGVAQPVEAAPAAPEPDTVVDGDTYVDVAELDGALPADAASVPAPTPAKKPLARRAPRTPRTPRPAKATRPAAAPTSRHRRASLAVMALLVPALVWGVYAVGAPAKTMPANHPATGGTATPAPQATFDAAKAEELNKRIAADPDDIEARRSLATMHFKVQQFAEAATVINGLLERRPQDFDSRLILGVAYFNVGDLAGAEREWTRCAQQDPKNADVHYNLGFLHMSTNPPDMAKVEAEWRLVVELAPGSEIAKTVTNHMEKLNGAAPSATPANPAAPSATPAKK